MRDIISHSRRRFELGLHVEKLGHDLEVNPQRYII
jgi:hypothetical protein